MPEDLYGLSLSDVLELRKLLQSFRAGELGAPASRDTRRPLRPEDTIIGTLDGAAAALSSLTGALTSATMSVYSFSSTGGTSDSGRNETVWNASKMQAVTGRWTVARRISTNARYVIIYQAASTTGCT